MDNSYHDCNSDVVHKLTKLLVTKFYRNSWPIFKISDWFWENPPLTHKDIY